MRSFVKTSVAAFVGAVLLVAPGAAQEKAKTKSKSEKPAKKAPEFTIPIPPGRSASGLRLPYYEGGVLQMYFNIGEARRIDDEHFALSNVSLETYDNIGTPEMTIRLPESILDMKTRIINGTKPVTIQRSDFEITGDTAVFNTRTRVGHFVGNVRMLIYDGSDFSSPKSDL